jgi:hypothetical protein
MMMVAGSVASLISSSEDTKLSATGKNDTASPVVGWWFFFLVDDDENNAIASSDTLPREKRTRIS